MPCLVSSCSSSSCHGRSTNTTECTVWYCRIVFTSALLVTATLLGWGSYRYMRHAEDSLANRQFAAVAERALVQAHNVCRQRERATVSMATILGVQYPHATTWPFVVVPGFEDMATSILETTQGTSMGMLPIVYPGGQEQDDWEDFVYDYYQTTRDPPFPNGTAISPDFGQGIWRFDKITDIKQPINPTGQAPSPPKRVHDRQPAPWGSLYDFLTPVVHVESGPNTVLMFNMHSDPHRGKAMDRIVQCIEQRNNYTNTTNTNTNTTMTLSQQHQQQGCASVTSITYSVKQGDPIGAAVIQMAPILPKKASHTVVGFVPTLFSFDVLLHNLFAPDVTGIDCVISSDQETVTYTIVKGEPVLQGFGDIHEITYNRYRKSVRLTSQEEYAPGTPQYKLCLYPTSAFYDTYHTQNPRFVTVGIVGIILCMTLIFFVYDAAVRRQFTNGRELLQAKRQFMRFVSHEVRTPLNSVVMGLHVVQTEICKALRETTASNSQTTPQEPLPEPTTTQQKQEQKKKQTPTVPVIPSHKAREWCELTRDILNSAQSAVDVLTDTLNYDKIQSGTFSFELEEIYLSELVEQTMEEFRLSCSNKDLKLDLCIDDRTDDSQNAMIVVDRVRFTQVLRNLLSNAIKFTPQAGSIHVTVNSSDDSTSSSNVYKGKMSSFQLKHGENISRRLRGYAEIHVTDSGAGMSPEQLSNLFREGVQFNPHELQQGGGAGLGLYLSKGIVEQLGGLLTASSEGIGKGSTFTVRIPLYKTPLGADTDASCLFTRDRLTKNETSTTEILPIDTSDDKVEKGLQFLVVDDSMSNRKFLCRMLTSRGHTCDQAENGRAAVDQVGQAMERGIAYDMILLDYEMPVLNGPETARELREMQCTTFIVAITGNILPDDVAYFRSCGANAVLPKPLRMDDLEALWKTRAEE